MQAILPSDWALLEIQKPCGTSQGQSHFQALQDLFGNLNILSEKFWDPIFFSKLQNSGHILIEMGV